MSTGEPEKAQGIDWNHPCAAHPIVKDAEKAIVLVEPRRTKVALVGFASPTRGLAPFDDPSYEIWGLNQLDRHIPRADRWFDIHHNYLEHTVEGTDYDQFLKTIPIPVYMKDHHTEYPNSVRFPIEKAIAAYGDYYQSTIAYMLALALLEDFQEIALFGIDLVVGQEWDYQKPNAEYFIGLGVGLGRNMIVPGDSALCKHFWRYGYVAEPETGLIKQSELQARASGLLKEKERLLTELNQINGAIQENAHWREVMMVRVRGAQVNLPKA